MPLRFLIQFCGGDDVKGQTLTIIERHPNGAGRPAEAICKTVTIWLKKELYAPAQSMNSSHAL